MIDRNSDQYLKNVLVYQCFNAFNGSHELPITKTWSQMISEYDEYVASLTT